jgi:hypothetical protein
MSLWHRHLWRETSRQFNQSERVMARATGTAYLQLARELEFGITVVELRCEACGDVKAVRYVGDSGNRGAQA